MARDTRAAFLRALAEVEPRLADAFEAAIQDVRSTAQRRAIEEAIDRAIRTGNIGRGVQEVQAALQLGQEFFAPLDRAIQEAFEAGAVYQLSTLPKRMPNAGPLVVRFQGRNPRAERWTREAAARLITEIAEDTEATIRETLTEAVEVQRPYRRVARDLIGTTQGNERKGGLIGLHSSQARAVRNARAELESGDFAAYRQRTRRDRSYDRTIAKAQREGRGLTAAEIDRITGRYSDRLLQLRGQTIARTEGNKAMQQGRTEAIRQMVEDGKVRPDLITKIWDAVTGPRTRDSHLALNGQVRRWDEPFVSPITGAALNHPHDESAPAAEVVNCRCTARYRIDWAAMAQ